MSSSTELLKKQKQQPPRQPSFNDLFANKQPSFNDLPEIIDVAHAHDLPDIVDVMGTGVQPVDISDMLPQRPSVQPVDITDTLPQRSSVQPVDISDLPDIVDVKTPPSATQRKASGYDLLKSKADTVIDKYYNNLPSSSPWEKTVAKGAAALLAAPVSMVKGAVGGVQNFLKTQPFKGGFIQPQYAPLEVNIERKPIEQLRKDPSADELRAIKAATWDIPAAVMGGAIHEGLPLPLAQGAEALLAKGTSALSKGVDLTGRAAKSITTAGAIPFTTDNLAGDPGQLVENLTGGAWGPEQQENELLPMGAKWGAEFVTNPLVALHLGGRVAGGLRGKAPKVEVPRVEEAARPAEAPSPLNVKPAEITPEDLMALEDKALQENGGLDVRTIYEPPQGREAQFPTVNFSSDPLRPAGAPPEIPAGEPSSMPAAELLRPSSDLADQASSPAIAQQLLTPRGVPDQANNLLSVIGNVSADLGNRFNDLTAGKLYNKWFRPGGEFPASLEPSRRIFMKEMEMGPAKAREYGNLTEMKYDENGRPLGPLGAAQFAEKLSEPEYNLMMQAVHDADPTLLNQIRAQDAVTHNGQNIPITEGFRQQVERGKHIWEQSRDMTSDTSLITPEMRAQGYTPDSWLLTTAMKEDFAGLQDIMEHPGFRNLNPKQQAAIKRLVTGDIQNPDFLWKDQQGRGALDMLKEKTAKTPSQASWLGGKLPQNYIDILRITQMWNAGSVLKFARSIADNPDCVRIHIPGEIPPRGWTPLYANPFENKGAVPKMVGELLRTNGDVMIREGVLRELKDHFNTGGNVIGNRSPAEQLLQGTEKVTNPWKGAVTIGNPETHLSNAAWNKIASYIATGPLKASDRAFVNRAMSGIGMNIESQVAELSGIMNAGFMTEFGSKGRPSLAEMLLDEPAQQGAGKLLRNAKKAASAAAEMASQRYQGAEIKAKAGIVGSQLRQNGYTFRNNALVTPDGRVITDMKQLTPEDVQTIRSAGELADGFLFDYADQSRAVKLLRRTIDPFLTFWVNLLPLVSKLSVGMGPGTNGRPNLKMLTRFYTVPSILYSAGKLSQLLSGIDEDEMKKLRDTRDDAYLRRDLPFVGDVLSDTTHPLLPVRYNSQTGKYYWGWDKSDPNAHPVALNLMNVLPYSQLNKPIGALSLPQALFPSGPWIDTMITAATGKRTFANQQVIDPYSDNPRMDLLKYSALNMLPQAKAADRLMKAAKGEPSRMGEKPDTIATALFKSLSPVKVDVVNPELSDTWKRAAFKAEEAGFRKSIYKKYAPLLQLNAGNPERIRQIQADMEREHLRRQAKLLLDSYPSQARDRNTQWGQMKSSIDERLKALK